MGLIFLPSVSRQGLDLMIFKGPIQPKPFCDSTIILCDEFTHSESRLTAVPLSYFSQLVHNPLDLIRILSKKTDIHSPARDSSNRRLMGTLQRSSTQELPADKILFVRNVVCPHSGSLQLPVELNLIGTCTKKIHLFTICVVTMTGTQFLTNNT